MTSSMLLRRGFASVSASDPVDSLRRHRPLHQFLTFKCYAHLRTPFASDYEEIIPERGIRLK